MEPVTAPVKQPAKKSPAKAPSPARLRTAGGITLTRTYEKQLVEEAEAGIDLSALQPRKVGRPSLNGRPGKSHRLDLRVDDEIYVAVHDLAERQQRPVSEIVRAALRRFIDGA